MSKLMIAMPSDKTPPLYDFFNDELNEKQRQKLLSLFALMLQAPVSVMREPYVKHFTLERYSSLYELRAKSKTLVRIIFILAFLYLRRPNAAIYAMNAKGVAYKKLGRQRIAVRNPKLDFTKLKEYPAGDSSVELKNKLARKLAGRLISIRLYDGVRTHLVEPIDGNETENYWFAVKDEDKEGSEL